MSFTLHIELEDFGHKAMAGVIFTVAPMNMPYGRDGNHLALDHAEGVTDEKGVVDIELSSVDGAVWMARSTARGKWVFRDPGDGVTINLIDVLNMPDETHHAQVSEIAEAMSQFAYATGVTYDVETQELAFLMSNGKRMSVTVPIPRDTDAVQFEHRLQAVETLALSKQDALVLDSSPSAGSTNVVTSDGIYAALDAHVKDASPHMAYDDMSDLSLLYRSSAT